MTLNDDPKQKASPEKNNQESKDLKNLQTQAVTTNLEKLWEKAKNIMEYTNTVMTSFNEKMTKNSKTIVSIIEMFRSLKIFDKFFSPVNQDSTPNERNKKILEWLGVVYKTEYDLSKSPYSEFISILNTKYKDSTLFATIEYTDAVKDAVKIQDDKNQTLTKINSFLALDGNKNNFKELFKSKSIKWVIDKDFITTVLKNNANSWISTTDFFDAEWEVLETVDETKLNSLIDLIFLNDTVKKTLWSVSWKLIDGYANDKASTKQDKRIKSDSDIAYFLFAILCKPNYTQQVALYNTLPSEVISKEKDTKKINLIAVSDKIKTKVKDITEWKKTDTKEILLTDIDTTFDWKNITISAVTEWCSVSFDDVANPTRLILKREKWTELSFGLTDRYGNFNTLKVESLSNPLAPLSGGTAQEEGEKDEKGESEEDDDEDEDISNNESNHENSDSSDLVDNEKYIKYVREQIFETESKWNYGAVNKNDHWSASIGLLQFNWNAENAPRLLKKMYEKDSDLFVEKLSASSWYKKFKKYKDWWEGWKWAIWNPEDVVKFKYFMEEKDMKEVMDQEVNIYTKKYVKNCIDKWITDPKMITYLCRIQNFGKVPFDDIVSQLEDKTSFVELNEKTVAYMKNKALSKSAYSGKADYYNDSYASLKNESDEKLWVA